MRPYLNLFRPDALRQVRLVGRKDTTGAPTIRGLNLSQLTHGTTLKAAFLVAIFSRLFVFVVALASNYFFGVDPSCHATGCWNLDLPFINLFSRWDSGYYADIALSGYPNAITARWEFFPFYSILIGTVGRLLAFTNLLPLKLAVYVSGFAVSNLAYLGSIYYLYKLSERIFGDLRFAFDSTLFLALFPAGVFLSAVYSESLFLLLTLGSLYYWRVGKVWRSAGLGYFAALTRPVGVFLVVPFLYEVFVDASRRKSASMYVPVAVTILGYLTFMAYSQLMTGTPFANFTAERLFFGVNYNPHDLFVLAMNEMHDHPITIPFLALGIGGVAGAIPTAKSQPERSVGVYGAVLLFLYLCTPPIISFGRYSLTLLPVYWSLSKCSRKSWIRAMICAIFLVLLAIGTGLFVNWYSFY